jgi:hypothetical protein
MEINIGIVTRDTHRRKCDFLSLPTEFFMESRENELLRRAILVSNDKRTVVRSESKKWPQASRKTC